MDQQQVRWAMLKISMVALVCSSWIFTSFVFDTRPTEIEWSAVDAVTEDALVSLVRLPASLPGVHAQIPKLLGTAGKPFEPIRMDVVRLPCWDAGETAEQPVAARWVRLTGKPCQTGADPESIEVWNLSNGYAGTVFKSQSDQMTTDFMPLQEGNNDILMRFGFNEGVALESRFVLVKASAE